MNAIETRQRLEQLGVPAEALDAYELEVRRAVAEQLYDAPDNGSSEGCWCATLVDPDAPCPSCKDHGGARLGDACYLCGLERTTPPPPRGPSPLIPLSLLDEIIAHRLYLRPAAPHYTGVLEYLAGGDP